MAQATRMLNSLNESNIVRRCPFEKVRQFFRRIEVESEAIVQDVSGLGRFSIQGNCTGSSGEAPG